MHLIVEFKKDSRWDLWGINSIQFFKNISNNLIFKPIISDEIIKRFEVIKKLILYSYFEYEFLDVAFQSALMTFELALKIRFEELVKRKPSKKELHLYNLIKWGASENLFEDDEFIVHSLRKLRNSTVHPRNYQLFGYLVIEVIQGIVDTINGLYENIDLRKARKSEKDRLNELFEKLIKNGAILETNNKRLIIFKAILLYFNNIAQSAIYYFLFWPIFNPEIKDDNITICDPIIIPCIKWEYQESNIIFGSSESYNSKLTKIDRIENQTKYNNWKQDFDSSSFPLSYLINIQIGELRSKYSKL